jgi:hypothetical protein
MKSIRGLGKSPASSGCSRFCRVQERRTDAKPSIVAEGSLHHSEKVAPYSLLSPVGRHGHRHYSVLAESPVRMMTDAPRRDITLSSSRSRPSIPLSTLRSSSSVLCAALLHCHTRLDLSGRRKVRRSAPSRTFCRRTADFAMVLLLHPPLGRCRPLPRDPFPIPAAPTKSELRHHPNAPPTSSAIPDERKGRVNRSAVVRYGPPASKEEPPHALFSLPALAGRKRPWGIVPSCLRDVPMSNPCEEPRRPILALAFASRTSE